MGRPTTWTDERKRRLLTLWKAGYSASRIAEILGDVTRNAVISMAHRLEVKSRPSPIKEKGSGTRPRAPDGTRMDIAVVRSREWLAKPLDEQRAEYGI